MVKFHIEQIKEKADGVFKETFSKERENLCTEVTSSNGKIRHSVQFYVLSFNSLLNDFHKTALPRPIFQEALYQCSIIVESSAFLALHSFYRSANSELRTALEQFFIR
ncbi:hypothetical protein HZB88_05450, partial [archaeon]|nr:hypothetical protein [archaeon]